MHASILLFTCLVLSNPLILSLPTSPKPTEKKVFRAAIALVVDERGFDPQYHQARKTAFLQLQKYFPIGKNTSSVALFQQIDDQVNPVLQFTDNEEDYTKAIEGWKKDATNTDSQLQKGMRMAKDAFVKIQDKFKVMVIFVQGVPQTITIAAAQEALNTKGAGIYVHVVCIDACSVGGSTLAAGARSLASDSEEVTKIESQNFNGDEIFKNVTKYTAHHMCTDKADTCSFTSENRSKCVQDTYLLWAADGSVTGCNDTSPTTKECDIIKCEQFCDKMWPWEKNQNCKNATDPAAVKRTGPMPQPIRILKNCEQKCNVSATTPNSTLDLSTTPRVSQNGTKKCKNGTKKCNKCEKICGGPWYTWWYFWVLLVLVLINCWMLYRIWYEWDVPNTIFNFGWWQWLYCKFTKKSWRQYKREHAATRRAATRINEKMQDLGKKNQEKNQMKKGKRH